MEIAENCADTVNHLTESDVPTVSKKIRLAQRFDMQATDRRTPVQRNGQRKSARLRSSRRSEHLPLTERYPY